MARPTNGTATRDEQFLSFDVTVSTSIGTVTIDREGDEHPHIVAFKLIGAHGMPGVYRFPMENGSVCVVDVEHVQP